MMDRKTILIVLACMLVLIGSQRVINKLYPPVPKKAKPAPALASTNTPEAVATNVVAAIAPAPAAVPPAQDQERAPEQIVALSNEFIRVEFTSWGGGIRSVELLQHRANGHGHAVLNGADVTPALALIGVPGAGTNAVFEVQQTDARTVVMRSATHVTKTFTLSNDYLMAGSILLPTDLAATATDLVVVVGTATPTQPKESPVYLGVDWQNAPKFFDRSLSRVTSRANKGLNQELIHAAWVAVKSQYFTMILSPATNAVGVSYAPVELPPTPETVGNKTPLHGVTATAEVPLARAPDGDGTCTFTFYAGPKDYDRLLALGQNQEEVMALGTWMDGYTGIFGVVLLRSMMFFYRLIPNFGVAIILVTIAIKIIFWPIQAKSIKSMKEMQKFQPQVQKLKEKYKDDPQRLNQETMKLYREHKINPLSGCLPMLVQLPVLFGFYKVLLSDIALRGASFLWIKDLSQPDTILTVAGFPVNPLPLVMVGTQIWQQKITPTSGDPQQAKMMMFMPLIMLIFFYKVASGLVLYWTLQQLLSIAQQWWSLRHEKKTAPADKPLPAGKSK
ncbi:MAG TPA: membrane protein insertase YidC [Verrucomicrobiae bacterium]|nr:membrane protein insertase YidC [Verrucomicrobiae bacterium]